MDVAPAHEYVITDTMKPSEEDVNKIVQFVMDLLNI